MIKISESNSHWERCKLDELQIRISNGANVTQHESKVGYPISRIETIWNETIDFNRVKYIEESDDEFIEKYALHEDDILLSHINSDLHLGKTAIFKNQKETLIHGINLLLVRLSKHISSSFINYQFRFLRHSGLFIANAQRSVNQSSINQTKLKSFTFLLPPYCEQIRIVEKIEELFSELDKGIESLKTAKAQLSVYRQTLLKNAFEGKLTEQWRKDNADKLESPKQLLARIEQEREDRYQQQFDEWEIKIEQWKEDGKEGKKPTKPTRIATASIPTDCNHINIPKTWQLFSYGDLCSVVRNGISKKPVGNEGVKIFRISAVRALSFDMSDYRFINNESGEFDNFYLQQGDIVFTRYNGSKRYVGVCAQYNSEEPRLFPDKLVQTRPNLPSIHTPFLEKSLNSGFSRRFVESRIRTTAGQSGVSGTDIKQIPVPVCSIEEQIEINSILEAKLSVIESMETETGINLKKSELLRQSILKKAFSGQLVAQNSSDEAANELLQKIAIEKAELAAKEKADKAAAKKAKAVDKKA